MRARHFQTGRWVDVDLEGPEIVDVVDVPMHGPPSADDDWVAPAFWDLQFNGRWGVSFSAPDLQPEQVAEIVHAQAALGSARVCPTLITASRASMCAGLRASARACDASADLNARVVGIHMEGPYISGLDGYRGAHPEAEARDPSWDEFQAFQEAAGGRVVLMTLAPEREGALEFIERAVKAGVAIALGHTAADGRTLRAAASAGATLSTHLGNGIVSPLPRHPNAIWEQGAIDALSASFIGDGHHIDNATLRVLVRSKTPARTILVSDASPLAGLPPGTYGKWAVHRSGRINVAGTPYLAGSNQGLETGLNTLLAATGMSLHEALATVTENPSRLLYRPAPLLERGEPANLVRFRIEKKDDGRKHFRLMATCVHGSWTLAGEPMARLIRPLTPDESGARS